MQMPKDDVRNTLQLVLEAWPVLAATAAFGIVAGVLLY
jgi:hypothetical protein